MTDEHTDHQQIFNVAANGRQLTSTGSYGDAVAAARSHTFRTGEHTAVEARQRFHAGRERSLGTRWRSDREGGF